MSLSTSETNGSESQADREMRELAAQRLDEGGGSREVDLDSFAASLGFEPEDYRRVDDDT